MSSCATDQTQGYAGKIHLTLVHGTFAKHAPWTAADSPLCKHLDEHVPGIEFHNFTWSGWPCHFARAKAARKLHAELSCRIRKYPTDRHCIIAHSHGGNIACYAACDPDLAEKLHCIVTLSTPFLVCRRRQPSPFARYALTGSLVAFFLVCLFAIQLYSWGASTISDLLRISREMHEHPLAPEHLKSSLTFMLLFGLLVGLICMVVWLVASLRRWLIATLKLPNLQNDRLFVVRGPADGANALLVTIQLLDIVIAAFWERNGAMDRLLKRLLLKRLSVRFKEATALVGRTNLFTRWLEVSSVSGLFLLFVLLSVAMFFYWTQTQAYLDLFSDPFSFFQRYTTTTLVIWACLALIIALIHAPILLLKAAQIVYFGVLLACGATIGIIVGMTIMSVAFIMLFVIPELGPLVMILTVSAEASPPGLFRVLQLTTDLELDIHGKRMHSITYTHPRALDEIAKVVAANRYNA